MSATATLSAPARESDFDAHYHNVVEYVLAKVMPATPEWTHIPRSEAEALAAYYTAWHTAYEATLVPHVPAIRLHRIAGSTRSVEPVTAVKNAAFKNSNKALWDFRDDPPANIEDLKEVITDTDSPAKITFLESDRGKKVWVTGAWQIEREGEIGPWSDIGMFVVP
jgi:hypothetical protein